MICFHLTSNPTDSATFPSTRSVQGEANEVRGPCSGASPSAHPGTGRTRQVARLQQIRVQRQSGGEEGHSGRKRPQCGHRGHSGLSSSVE